MLFLSVSLDNILLHVRACLLFMECLPSAAAFSGRCSFSLPSRACRPLSLSSRRHMLALLNCLHLPPGEYLA